MLRLLCVLLLVANGAYLAWSQGWLGVLGLAPASQSEPLRVVNQLKPGSVRLSVGDEGSRPADVALPTALACLQAGPFDDPQVVTLRSALASLPATAWQLEPVAEPERWMVYMGKYTDEATLARKKAELKRRNIDFDPVTVANLQPGLSLGRYSTEANANTALKLLLSRGVTTARVVVERPESRSQMLRLPVVDEALRGKLDALKPALAGKPLRNCS